MTRSVLVVVLLAFFSTLAAAQNTRFDVALSGAAAFSKTVTSSSGTVTDSPTTNLGEIGSVRYHFNHLHSLEMNLGHVRNSQIFTIAPDTYRINTDVYEYSGAYVLTPFSENRLQPFLFGGAGALRFSPGKAYIDSVQGSFGQKIQTSLAFLYGAGVDYRLISHVALRVQYRGLIYKNPDFSAPSRFFTGAKGHMAEPAVGIVVKF